MQLQWCIYVIIHCQNPFNEHHTERALCKLRTVADEEWGLCSQNTVRKRTDRLHRTRKYSQQVHLTKGFYLEYRENPYNFTIIQTVQWKLDKRFKQFIYVFHIFCIKIIRKWPIGIWESVHIINHPEKANSSHNEIPLAALGGSVFPARGE